MWLKDKYLFPLCVTEMGIIEIQLTQFWFTNGKVDGYFMSQKQPQELFCKKLLLEMSQNPQENTCDRVSFLIRLQLYLKRDSGTGVFLRIL